MINRVGYLWKDFKATGYLFVIRYQELEYQYKLEATQTTCSEMIVFWEFHYKEKHRVFWSMMIENPAAMRDIIKSKLVWMTIPI